MAFSMIALPKESFDASIRGLHMWWEIVFPSLFPFFVISELLISFGVVTFMGVILEPLMRPLFRVPGVGGFAWAMGMATGFPAGANITAKLRKENEISNVEAERLISFTNSSGPLFIFGAVSVGFFGNPSLGIILAATHYLGNFSVGIMMRFYRKNQKMSQKQTTLSPNILSKALRELHRTRLKNKKPIGKLLGDAVISSIHTLLMIGGFIILFSVVNRLLLYLDITTFIGNYLEFIFSLIQLPGELSIPLIAGIFEITLGNQLTSEVLEANLMEKVILASFILGFSGLSVHAQVASIIAETDIRFKPFFIARIFHGFFSAIFTWLLWDMFARTFYKPVDLTIDSTSEIEHIWNIWLQLGPLCTIGALVLYIYVYTKRMKSI